MFTSKELNLVSNGYFKLIKYVLDENFIEIQSKNTKDRWIIQKREPLLSEYPIVIYHKHPDQKYYHHHWQCYTVSQSIKSIKSHDDYMLSKRRPFNVSRVEV